MNLGPFDGPKPPAADLDPSEPSPDALDDTQMRFAMIELGNPADPAPADVISLAKERELRDLRTKNAQLEETLAAIQGRLVAGVTTRERYEEEHGYKCGFHPRVTVSTTTKSVTCQVCGAEIEPMDVLREFARGERNFVQSINGLIEERKKLLKEVDELKKKRSSLRSQIKRKVGNVSPQPEE